MSLTHRVLVVASVALLAIASVASSGPNGAWVLLAPDGSGPSPREGYVMIYDPVRDRLIVHGGCTYASDSYDDLWAFPLATNGPWQQIVPAGPVPMRRAYHAATYDPVRQRMLIHGGMNAADAVWALSLSGAAAWDSLAPEGIGPGARWWHSLIDDPVNDRALVFAGAGASHDLYELQLGAGPDGTWVPLFPNPAPVSRCCQEAAYDSATFSMVIFGGWNGDELEDLWAYNDNGPAGGWRLLLASGPDRVDHAAVIDRKRHRLVTHGGEVHPTMLADVWAASLDAPVTWTQLTPSGDGPGARSEHAAVYDPIRDRMILFGGRKAGGWGGDLWALDFSAPVGVAPDAAIAPRLAIERASARGGAILLDLTLASGASIQVDVVDVAGRRVAEQTAQANAKLRVPVDGGSGVYFVRVRQGAQEARGRIALVR